jgi:hypothetical protein
MDGARILVTAGGAALIVAVLIFFFGPTIGNRTRPR